MPVHRRSRFLAIALAIGLLVGQAPAATLAAPPTMTNHEIQAGLAYPWDVGFLPDGSMLVTERPGRVRQYASGTPHAALIRTITIPNVWAVGEAGLMGIAVDTDFAANRFVYVCASRKIGSAAPKNEILRYTVAANGAWGSGIVILGNMAAANIHNGCALEMDQGGRLWATMGDASNGSLAQNRASLNGKVLRINRNGSTPSDNPVISGTRNAVYSMGHRNPQGLAFRSNGQVFAVEHGPNRDDEINRIVAGGNYGWPCYTGNGVPNATSGCGPAGNYLSPIWASGSPTIATSGAAFSNGSQWADFNGHLWVSQLKQQDVRRFSINAGGTSLGNAVIYLDGSERFRAMVSGPGGQLYVTTSNGDQDGNGLPDDRVLRMRPTQPVVARIAGADRYATAAAISRSVFGSGGPAVLVATGSDYPDALAGGAAAGHLSYPVLLVQRDAIPAATRTELDRLNPQRVVVLGGTAVVSEAVRNALVPYASTGEVLRIAGANRHETAAKISARWYAPGVQAAFVATGSGFADALAGAPAAALRDSPLLLVNRDGIPAATATELDRLNPQRIYVLGGGASISSAVATALHQYTTGPVTRLAGTDRYGTAAAVVRAFWTRTSAYVATGRGFADALTGGAVAGKSGVPMLLVDTGLVPLTIGQEVLRLGSARLTVLGGTAAVNASAVARLKVLLGTP